MIEIGKRSGTYTGNGTTQDILFSTEWKVLRITRYDRAYIMTYVRDDDDTTIGQGAIGSGGTFKQIEAVTGGVTELDNGFSVGDHVSVNASGQEYFWEVN